MEVSVVKINDGAKTTSLIIIMYMQRIQLPQRAALVRRNSEYLQFVYPSKVISKSISNASDCGLCVMGIYHDSLQV